METRFILTDYLQEAMAGATYDKLYDGTFFGRIPSCTGVVAFAESLGTCQEELCSTLVDWVLLGLKLRHEFPVIAVAGGHGSAG